mmetsp:Transcript_1528/g.3494  ORF Transcript_1528/g.3494 Transcript_1528/m.3494 type:complete len:103 (-) Transcript_1528:1121-1429(-)
MGEQSAIRKKTVKHRRSTFEPKTATWVPAARASKNTQVNPNTAYCLLERRKKGRTRSKLQKLQEEILESKRQMPVAEAVAPGGRALTHARFSVRKDLGKQME